MSHTSESALSEDLLLVGMAKSAWRQRSMIAMAAGFMLLIGFAFGWTRHPQWTASARILPPANQSSRFPFDLNGLSAISGIRLGGSNPVELYPAVFYSDAVLLPTLASTYQTSDSKSVNLIEEFQKKSNADPERRQRSALAVLRRAISVVTDRKSDVVTLSVQSRDPVLSAAIANKILESAEVFYQTSAATTAGSQRLFIEGRLAAISEQLHNAEQELFRFRTSHRDIAGSPLAQMEYERLVRDISIQSTIYTELSKELEMTKVEQMRNTPILRVLDHASAPLRPTNSKIKTALVVFVLGTALIALLIVFLDMLRTTKNIYAAGRSESQ